MDCKLAPKTLRPLGDGRRFDGRNYRLEVAASHEDHPALLCRGEAEVNRLGRDASEHGADEEIAFDSMDHDPLDAAERSEEDLRECWKLVGLPTREPEPIESARGAPELLVEADRAIGERAID